MAVRLVFRIELRRDFRGGGVNEETHRRAMDGIEKKFGIYARNNCDMQE